MKKYTAPHLTVEEFEFTAEVVASYDPVYNLKNGGLNNQNCVQNDTVPGYKYERNGKDYVCA